MWRRLSLISCSLLFLCRAAEARTGADLITDLRIMLGQVDSSTNTTNWSNAQLRRILNMGQDKVTARGRVVERDTTYAASGTTRYPRPSGFITLGGTAYLVRAGETIVPIALTSSDSIPRQQTRITNQSVGDDEFLIYEEAREIVVSPPILSRDSVKVVFYANPATIQDTSECEYENEWEIVLLIESKLIACEKNHDTVWYQLTVAERDKILEEMYRQTRLRPQVVVQP